MKSLRNGTDVMGVPIDRDTRRARLLAARRKPVGSLNRKGISAGTGMPETSWEPSATAAAASSRRPRRRPTSCFCPPATASP